MKTTIIAAALAVASGQALAGNVWLNSAKVSNYTETGSVGQAKYRMSNTNFDMSLDHGLGTNPGQFISHGLGNNTQLNNVVFNFSVNFIAGEGMIFRMVNTNTNAAFNLAWGTFSSPLPAGTTNSVATLNGFAPNRSFNTIQLFADARFNPSQMQWSNLAFTSAGLTVADNSLLTGGQVENPENPGSPPPGTQHTQRIVSDMDLSTFNWTLTGQIRGYRTGAGGDELTRYVIGLKESNFQIIPLPTGAGLAFAGLGVLGVRRRRA
ncbi:MAG: VPLPA-CTERM sorting domain-containing protein [Planctomycetota bacterium]|nr:VPLPA-CTERM sorting domain-containing protein [Planctomycetota bacterium]